jgi:nitrite reductase/ring-hydroxylating ferredoxin subunit
VARVGGELYAMANRCSHRGGPLHEGELDDGCVTCPWHGSRFRLADGSVERGPAAYPQPSWRVRVQDGTIQVAPPEG